MSLRTMTCGVAVVLATLSPAVLAAESAGTIVAINAISGARLTLYSGATLEAKVKDVAKDSVKVPLRVTDVAEGERFLKIDLDGEKFWVRKVQVDVLRDVSTGCLAATEASIQTAGIRGANRGCAK